MAKNMLVLNLDRIADMCEHANKTKAELQGSHREDAVKKLALLSDEDTFGLTLNTCASSGL